MKKIDHLVETICWIIVLIACIISCAVGDQPSWLIVFSSVGVLIFNSLAKYLS